MEKYSEEGKTMDMHNVDSKSYIIVESQEDYNSQESILGLRTDPPTPIPLKKGVNILTVEEYPELKYGFVSMAEDFVDALFKIDLSHFDGSEMTSMEEMFRDLQIEINFGNLNTSNVTNVKNIFWHSEINPFKNSPSLKFNLDLSNVKDWGEGIFGDVYECGTIDLRDCVNLEYFTNLSFNIGGICNLILDGLELKVDRFSQFVDSWDRFSVDEVLCSLSMKGCKTETIKKVAQAFLDFANYEEYYVTQDNINDYIIVDPKIKLKFYPDTNSVTVHQTGNFTVCTYSEDGKKLLKVSKDAIYVAVNEGVEIIAPRAFEDCENLIGIYLPNTVKEIGEMAFKGCKSLKKLNIPDSVEEIWPYAFEGCKSLHYLFLGNHVKTLMKEAFTASGIQTLELPIKACRGIETFSENENIKHFIIYSYSVENSGDKIRDTFVSFIDNGNPIITLSVIHENRFPYSENGCLIDNHEYMGNPYGEWEEDKEIEGIGVVKMVPADCIAIPEGIEVLGAECLCDNDIIYIPSSVTVIHPNVLKNDSDAPSYIILKKSYLEKFMEIIPESFGDVKLILV